MYFFFCTKFGGYTVMLDLLKLLSDACSTADKYFLTVMPLPGMAKRGVGVSSGTM
jgi:hypothetical protein